MSISKMSLKAQIVETATNTATDWFGTNLLPNEAQQSGELLKWVFQIHVNTTTVVNLHIDIDGYEIIWAFNQGSALVEDSIYVEEVCILNGVTGVNMRHATTNQDVSVFIGEIRDFNSVN